MDETSETNETSETEAPTDSHELAPDDGEDPAAAVESVVAQTRAMRAERDDPSGILDPTDLSLDTEHSRDLGDGRLVVSVADDGTASARPLDPPEDDAGGRFAGVPDQFAVDLAVKTDHGVATHEVRTDDVREAFGDLIHWYAGRIAPGEDPRAVVELLLSSGALDG